jgi:hypothetical protein
VVNAFNLSISFIGRFGMVNSKGPSCFRQMDLSFSSWNSGSLAQTDIKIQIALPGLHNLQTPQYRD